MGAGQAHVESTPDPVPLGKGPRYPIWPSLGQTRVGMQEEQNVATRYSGAFVHLSRPTGAGRVAGGGERARHIETIVPAAAIDDDELVYPTAQSPEFSLATPEGWRIVEDRNDNGKPRQPVPGRDFGPQASAPPQLLPWPAVQA